MVGSCVLKLADCAVHYGWGKQPPSGGCVLKPLVKISVAVASSAAAFGRLCVETIISLCSLPSIVTQPPSGGCVLKL